MTSLYTLLILAGGRGSRVGGQDKGLLSIDGRALVDTLLAGLSPPPARVVISANRNIDTYRRRADAVVADRRPDFPGPMAGLEAGLAATGGAVLCLPCDLHTVPPALPPALLNGLTPNTVRVIEDDRGLQPLCLGLEGPRWAVSVRAYLDNGGRSVRGWLDRVPHERVRIKGRLENLNRVRG